MPFVFFIVKLISKLPISIMHFVAQILGFLFFKLGKNRIKVMDKNLRLAYPMMTNSQRLEIIKENCKYLILSGLEYSLLFYAKLTRILDSTIIKNKEVIDEYIGKRPIILLAPHMLNMEFATAKLVYTYGGCSINSEIKNPYVDTQTKAMRHRIIHDEIKFDVHVRTLGIRKIISYLKDEKRIFYFFPDQDFSEGPDTNYVPFFAHPYASTTNLLPKLVKLTNAVVIPVCTYKEGVKNVVEILPALKNYPSGDLISDVTYMNKVLSDMIDQHKEQYLWAHKRFKSQPNKVKGSIYNE